MLPHDDTAQPLDIGRPGPGEALQDMRGAIGGSEFGDDLDDETLIDDHRCIRLIDRDRPLGGILSDRRIDESRQRAPDAVAGRGRGPGFGHNAARGEAYAVSADIQGLTTNERVH